MAGILGDQDNGYSSLEDDNAPEPQQAEQTPAVVIDAALARLRARAGCQEDSFVRRLSTSLLSRMARNIFRRWESTRNETEGKQELDFLVTEELFKFANREEITDEYDRRNAGGTLEHDELEEQRRSERVDYQRPLRRRSSHSRSTEDPALDLDILQPVRVRSSSDNSPMSPMRGLADPEELRSFQRTEHVRIHRRRSSRHLAEEAEKEERRRLRRLRRSVDSMESNKSADSFEAMMSPKKDDPVEGLETTGITSDVQDKFDSDKAECSDLPKPEEAQQIEDSTQTSHEPSVSPEPVDDSSNLQSSADHTSSEYLEMKSLTSSISSMVSESASELQLSEASNSSEANKAVATQDHVLPSANTDSPNESSAPSDELTNSNETSVSYSTISDLQGSGASISSEVQTSVSSEVDRDGTTRYPELPSGAAAANVTPDETSTPTDEFLTSIEENAPTEAEQETGARPKMSQKDKERRKKRTRQVIQSLSNRQITSLRSLDITITDIMELLIQLSVSLDRLDKLINGSRNRGTNNVDDITLLQFFEALENARARAQIEEVPDLNRNDPSIPEVSENPHRDPKDDA